MGGGARAPLTHGWHFLTHYGIVLEAADSWEYTTCGLKGPHGRFACFSSLTANQVNFYFSRLPLSKLSRPTCTFQTDAVFSSFRSDMKTFVFFGCLPSHIRKSNEKKKSYFRGSLQWMVKWTKRRTLLVLHLTQIIFNCMMQCSIYYSTYVCKRLPFNEFIWDFD